MSDDWYRNTSWTADIAKAFEAKLRRARDKQQYLRIQACCLASTRPDVALELLDRYFQLPGTFDHAQAFVDRATAFRAQGRVEEALQAYEDALRREEAFPNLITRARLEFPLLVASENMRGRYEQALALLDATGNDLTLPVDRFVWNAAYALILSDQRRGGVTYARAALSAAMEKHSGFSFHPRVGLVADEYAEIVDRLRNVGNGIKQ